MEGLGQNDRADNIFLCPRCGTVKIDDFGRHGDKVYVPKLVERCRDFKAVWTDDVVGEMLWRKLGIAESINVPGDRS